jgi:carboxymethylenebutenolidase
MEPTTQTVPAEAIEAYNQYIHGHIDRRAFMTRINAIAATSRRGHGDDRGPDTQLRRGAAGVAHRSAHQDRADHGAVAQRQRQHQGPLARPASAGTNKLPSILVVHENRGLNPHIEDIARRLAVDNFMAFAPDGLTSVGGYPGNDDEGGQLFGKVDRAKMAEDLYAAAVWLKSRPDSTGKLGVTASASAAASPTPWPCAWGRTSRRRCRSTAARR